MKKWYKSSGINGILLNAIATISLAVASEINLPEQAKGAAQGASVLAMIAGILTSLNGRSKATEPIAWPWSSESQDISSEAVALLRAAIQETVRSGQLPDLDDAILYARNRIEAGPLPDDPYLPATHVVSDESDVPASLLADLEKIGAAPETESGAQPKYEFVAQRQSKLKNSPLPEGDGEPIAEGQSVYALAYALLPEYKHIEISRPGKKNTFLFAEHFKLRNQTNGHYELLQMPPITREWIE